MNQDQQPVARVTGYYGGNCVIEPLDGKTVFSSGMAVYSAPVAAQAAQAVDYAEVKRAWQAFRASFGEAGWTVSDSVDFFQMFSYGFHTGASRSTAPPSREWQGLTDEEIRQAYRSEIGSVTVSEAVMFIAVSRAIEAALRAKNSGEQA